jgi:pimeloyl-ACP methyl ester carboxylesterase
MRKLLRIVGWTFGVILTLLAILVAHANYRIRQVEVLTIDQAATGRLLSVQGHELHVRTIGDIADQSTPPLLLVHGFAIAGHTTFLPWAQETLAPRRALILADMLGYGYSERVATAGEHYTVRSHARDLALLLDELGVQRVDVVGHSWGGVIVAQLARDYPRRVGRLVIVDGGFFVYATGSPLETITDLPLGIGDAVIWHALTGGPRSMNYHICGDRPTCELYPPANIAGSIESQRATMRTSRSTPGIADLEAHLGEVRTPTLILWGSGDRITPVSNGERLAREIPGAKLVVVKDAWHMPWLNQPAETARAILAFTEH